MMLLAKIKRNEEAKEEINIYYNWQLYFSDTWNPTSEIITKILFKISGKTYKEKQENLRNLAIEYQTSDTSGLSWGELAEIGYFFEINGKRYGLLKEFKENCII